MEGSSAAALLHTLTNGEVRASFHVMRHATRPPPAAVAVERRKQGRKGIVDSLRLLYKYYIDQIDYRMEGSSAAALL